MITIIANFILLYYISTPAIFVQQILTALHHRTVTKKLISIMTKSLCF